jgi:flavin reductase (DIM6/NTAB) family NADH-FMN oxidoreductase RutF
MGNKIDCGKYPLIYPLPIALISANVDGKANTAPIGNCGIVSVDPAVIYISINKQSYTAKGIVSEGEFGINFASCDMIKEIDWAGMVSGRDIDKSTFFQYFYDESSKTPIVENCAVNIICKVFSTTVVHNQLMFVADIEKTLVSENCCTNGYADTKKINPIIYAMDNQYWSLGEHLGTGFNIGKDLL